MRLGIPELTIGLVALLFWLLPIVAGIWALITLQRIRTTQEDIRRTLAGIEQALQMRRST
jgi:hypothetical protein